MGVSTSRAMVRRKGADKSILHLSVANHARAKLESRIITEEEYKQIIASDKQFNNYAKNGRTDKTVTFALRLTDSDIPVSVSGPSEHTVFREEVNESIKRYDQITNSRDLIIIGKFMHFHPEFDHNPVVI